MCVCVCVCAYIYICIYIYIFTFDQSGHPSGLFFLPDRGARLDRATNERSAFKALAVLGSQ